ncbi:hypothetical protein NNJEOMEG_03620 [Fundidesulfovibrio magnetotacticus]|uniref:Uncharacterized protein n=1 Tax=Fundidesulfovibrio magnetotacticus TaxID=2730080 RepID=A0A6V8LTF5_9BACT|nr:hypothetical protein [Fundidesulfovibrio magnetotacticus]GFK95752.1 hypothetical protein NNJEOMEG_03620 [Fundidesulfovibrio magnetotacticus]
MLTLLHSPYDADSRDFLAALGVAEPESDDVTVETGGQAVRIVSDQAKAVAACPAFSRYPTFVASDGRVVSGPKTWQECLDFEAASGGGGFAPDPQALAELTRLDFLARFTEAELVLLKSLEASDPNVGLFWEQWRAATTVRGDDPRTVRALDYMTAQGHLAPGRKEAILAF